MRDAAAAQHRDVDLARPLLHVVDQLAERVDAERRRHRDRHRLLADKADRDEVANEIVRIVLGDLRQRDEARRQREQQRVAVRRRGARDLHADRAGRARMIGDEHLLAPVPRQPFGDDAGDDVGRAARAGGDDQLDRRVGEVLRGCGEWSRRRRANTKAQSRRMFVILLLDLLRRLRDHRPPDLLLLADEGGQLLRRGRGGCRCRAPRSASGTPARPAPCADRR